MNDLENLTKDMEKRVKRIEAKSKKLHSKVMKLEGTFFLEYPLEVYVSDVARMNLFLGHTLTFNMQKKKPIQPCCTYEKGGAQRFIDWVIEND